MENKPCCNSNKPKKPQMEAISLTTREPKELTCCKTRKNEVHNKAIVSIISVNKSNSCSAADINKIEILSEIINKNEPISRCDSKKKPLAVTTSCCSEKKSSCSQKNEICVSKTNCSNIKKKSSCCNTEIDNSLSEAAENIKNGCSSKIKCENPAETEVSRCTEKNEITPCTDKMEKPIKDTSLYNKTKKNSCCEDDCENSVTSISTCKETQNVSCCKDESCLKTPPETAIAIYNGTKLEFDVQGLTCTSCEKFLFKTLNTLPGITDVKTSLILNKAEFIYDPTILEPTQIMQYVIEKTGFLCKISYSKNSNQYRVLFNKKLSKDIQLLPGITNFELTDNLAIIDYDPSLIGIRDILHHYQEWLPELVKEEPVDIEKATLLELKSWFYRMWLSIFLCIPVLIFTYVELPEKTIVGDLELWTLLSFILATIIQFYVGLPIYQAAFKSLINQKSIEMDMLVVLSTTTAYLYSTAAMIITAVKLSIGTHFFETSSLLITIIIIGRYITIYVRGKTASVLKEVCSLQPHTAILVTSELKETEIDVSLLHIGDILKILPDQRIVTDGIIVEGESEVDESMITGEHIPVFKSTGHRAIAGTLNLTGTLWVKVTHLSTENTLSNIQLLIKEAQSSRAYSQEIADKIASKFTPVVVLLSIIVFLIWFIIGLVSAKNFSTSFVTALLYGITILIVSCPCAIGLAVPTVIIVASGVAARNGIIFKDAKSFETAYKCNLVVFDKTGTLTLGKFQVADEYILKNDNTKELILSVVQSSNHPLSIAIKDFLGTENLVPSATTVKSIPGKGLEAAIDGDIIKIGNAKWLNCENHEILKNVQNKSLVCISKNEELIAVYTLVDELKPEAKEIIENLNNLKIETYILSGDNQQSIDSLNLNVKSALGNCTPEDKLKYIKRKQQEGNIVFFCGDGTNDAPAIVQADIGVSMSTGTDIATSSSNIVLLNGDLRSILKIIKLSSETVKRIYINFGWSLIYNVFAIALAAGAFIVVRIPPELAALGELVSVLPVLLVAILFRTFKL
ncbi:hypothetical protein HK099_005740 [Clydaea vesicula]|uniref:HMA domain-containing protein n=1 Tax=Clydaea vesicula TaxID=447962 RepID=A0AAD5XXE4_9FUNG|nr:hypothetical protein HK099_005740 [Clydaea vesicula]